MTLRVWRLREVRRGGRLVLVTLSIRQRLNSRQSNFDLFGVLVGVPRGAKSRSVHGMTLSPRNNFAFAVSVVGALRFTWRQGLPCRRPR